MRYAYVRNLRKQHNKSGDATKNTKQCICARQMQFLKQVLSHNQTEDSIANQYTNPDEATEGRAIENGEDSNTQQGSSASTAFRRRKKSLEDNLEKYMAVVTKRSEASISLQKDEDYNFLLSTLLTIQQFNGMDKLKFRCDVMQLMMKYKEKSQSNQLRLTCPSMFKINHLLRLHQMREWTKCQFTSKQLGHTFKIPHLVTSNIQHASTTITICNWYEFPKPSKFTIKPTSEYSTDIQEQSAETPSTIQTSYGYKLCELPTNAGTHG